MIDRTSPDRIIDFSVESQGPFHGRYKIPWNDPEFSRRMLAEHLSQDHDLASRNRKTIAVQAKWIHRSLCGGRASRILDLGCGPGLYLEQLSALGHRCTGIDFSPAAIEHARANLPPEVELREEDLRTAAFGREFDVVLLLYGEVDVFSPEECRRILRAARDALRPGGTLLLEKHTFETVRSMGKKHATWSRHASGLFSDGPHLCLVESRWIEDVGVAQQFFHIVERESGATSTFVSTTQARTRENTAALLREVEFPSASVEEAWPESSPAFRAWRAVR